MSLTSSGVVSATWSTPRRFSRSDGPLVADFASTFLHVSKGVRAGEALELTGWQRQLLEALYERRPDGLLRYRRSLIGLGRKNGKSLLGSLIALYGLIEGEPGAEVYSATRAATSRSSDPTRSGSADTATGHPAFVRTAPQSAPAASRSARAALQPATPSTPSGTCWRNQIPAGRPNSGISSASTTSATRRRLRSLKASSSFWIFTSTKPSLARSTGVKPSSDKHSNT